MMKEYIALIRILFKLFGKEKDFELQVLITGGQRRRVFKRKVSQKLRYHRHNLQTSNFFYAILDRQCKHYHLLLHKLPFLFIVSIIFRFILYLNFKYFKYFMIVNYFISKLSFQFKIKRMIINYILIINKNYNFIPFN